MRAREKSHKSATVSRGWTYDAFISYSHSADKNLAPELQRLIRRVGQPWYKNATLRIFRDQTDLSASPSLWGSIETALTTAHHFVLMASPTGAQSPWVAREVRYWRENRSITDFYIVLTSGTIVYDPSLRDFDWSRTDALPGELSGWFSQQPLWIDLRTAEDIGIRRDQRNDRLRDVARTLAASLYGVSKSTIEGEDERESRRARRTLRGGIVALAFLTVAALVAASLAVVQLGKTQTQARISLARQLAALSTNALTTSSDAANLLAVAGFRVDPNPQTRAALVQAVTTSGRMVRYLPFGGHVSQVVGSADGRTVVAGTSDGRVLSWPLTDAGPTEQLRLGHEVKTVAVSMNGETIVAADSNDVVVRWPEGGPEALLVPNGQHPTVVSVSPSGRVVAVVSSAGFEQKSTLAFFSPTSRAPTATFDLSTLFSLAAMSDNQLLLLDAAYGSWEKRRISDGAVLGGSTLGFGAHNYATAVSADGSAFSYTNGDTTIPVWKSIGAPDIDHPPLTGSAPIAGPEALALDPTGSTIAAADTGKIYVALIGPNNATHQQPIELSGIGSVNPNTLKFFGSSRILLSATDDRVVVWNLDQADRLARTSEVPMASSCNACGGPHLSIAPDKSSILAIGGSGDFGVLLSSGRSAPVVLPDPGADYMYGPAAWTPDSHEVDLLAVPPTGGTQLPAVSATTPPVKLVPVGLRGSDGLVGAPSTDGRFLVVVEENGSIDLVDRSTAATREIAPAPPETAGSSGPAIQASAVSSSSDLVAVATEHSVLIHDAQSGSLVAEIGEGDVTGLTFTRDELLIQRSTGALEVWDERGDAERRVIAGDPSFGVFVAAADGRLVARQRSDSVVLVDLETGATLATLPPSGDSLGLKSGLAFSADSAELAILTEGTDNGKGQLAVRNIDDESLVRTACAFAGRNLTAVEWQELVGVTAPENVNCR